MFLDNVPMKRKLIGGFVCIIALALIIALIGFFSMQGMASKAQAMYDDNLVSLDQLLNADNSFLNIRINIYKTVFAKDERKDKFAEIDDEINNIKDKLDLYRSKASSDEEIALLKDFDTNWPLFETKLRLIISDMTSEKEKAVLEGIYADDFSTPRDAAQDALDKLEAYNQERARILKDEITQTYTTSSLIFLIIGIFTLIFGLGLALLLSRSITAPLSKGVWMLQEMSMGHLSHRLNMDRKDEIGILASTMDSYSEVLQSIAQGLTKIGNGDLSLTIVPKDDKDEFSPAMVSMLDALRGLVADSKALSQAAIEGKLATRGNVSKFSGGYREIIEGFNATLDFVINPVNEAMRLASSYAKGDYTDRIDEKISVKGDFIPFKEALNKIGIQGSSAIGGVISEIESLNGAMEETSASVEEVASSGSILAQNSTSVSVLAERSGSGIKQTLNAMEDLSSTVSEVATKAEQSSEMAKQTVELSNKGASLAENAERGMESIIRSFDETGVIITDISGQMEEIGKIVDVISGIAEQTGLLALNAAIEAARAGDAGLGFAVVADEVKSLALESQNSAENIATIIGNLQKKSKMVTESMKNSETEVKTGNKAVSETLKVFDEIVQAINLVYKNMTEVAGAAEEQAAAVEEITASVHEVENMVHNTAKEAVDSAAATEEVTATIDQITRAITEAAASVQRISHEMERFTVS